MSDEYSGPLLSAPADARFLLHPGDESRDPVFESLWVRTRTAGDAAGDAHWSALESLAWIATGDLAIVAGIADCAKHYRLAFGVDGMEAAATCLEQDISDHFCTEESRGEKCQCYAAAIQKLMGACATGELTATGVPADLGDRAVIPAHDFFNAQLELEGDGILRRWLNGKPDRVIWRALAFSPTEVMALLPARHAAPKSSRRRPTNLKAEATKWAKKGMSIREITGPFLASVWHDKTLRPSRDAAQEALRKAKVELLGQPVRAGRPKKNAPVIKPHL